jgi:argininosuccinate lyase
MAFPVVIKPLRGAASLNVRVVRSLDELKDAKSGSFDGSPFQGTISEQLLVEEYAEGALLSVEGVAFQGHFSVLAVSLRQRADGAEVVELGSVVPAPLRPELLEEVSDYAAAVCHALGFDRGICHIEMILTERGPFVIDFNARLPGVSIPRLYHLAYGRSMYDLALSSYLDEEAPRTTPRATAVAMNRLLGLAQPACVPRAASWDWLSDYRAYDLDVKLTKEGPCPATTGNMSYIGEMTLVAGTAEQAVRIMDDAAERLAKELALPLLTWARRDQEHHRRVGPSATV